MIIGYLNIPRIDVVVAETVDQALKALDDEPEREIMAAGTEIITSLTTGERRTRKFVDIGKIRELKNVVVADGRANVGALVTHHQLASTFGKQIPAFHTFFQNYSSPAVSYLATTGGSIMLKRATEDIIPILLTLDAELIFATKEGQKRVSLDEFLRRKLEIRGLLEFVSFRLSAGCWFDKLWMGISRFPLMSVSVDVSGKNIKVAVSHKDFETPGRVFSVEKFLENRPLTKENIEKAGELLSKSINPVDDVFASSWYRKKVAGVLLERLLQRSVGGAV
ncbi:MAG: FAD binding domain-containing protein [Candidatus Caldarchaeum sp.]|nr:FAD binding domain-containing protein [Candidatus Caldarchaeum sp.]